ncbi:MAG: tRNA 2-thiouridine(34) synthase MnmA [Proteobacteria bacterium]|nr:tRNA 2-thiouridine(34) synthase MnmA [Pseudomonadota bacterium]
MKQKIAIAVSGGIDSMMAAYLLKSEGHDVFGIHFITGYEKDTIDMNTIPDTIYPNKAIAAILPVSLISDQLGIHLKIIDLRHVFREKVVDYFVETYLKGRTPNPCLFCNPFIKFGILFDHAKKWGATKLATGHYARILTDKNGTCHLKKGIDPQKDQSYFLSLLTQEKLTDAVLPLGSYTKKDIINLSADLNLIPAIKNESQDICFIPDGAYHHFIEKQPEFKSAPGPIKNSHGEILGEHQGLHLFTVGQRRGINCPAAQAYYVSQIDVTTNTLVVGFKDDLSAAMCHVERINWIQTSPDAETEIQIKVRYSQKEIPARIKPVDRKTAIIYFNEPVFPVTPGQGAVFIKDDEILGGGIIARGCKE